MIGIAEGNPKDDCSIAFGQVYTAANKAAATDRVGTVFPASSFLWQSA